MTRILDVLAFTVRLSEIVLVNDVQLITLAPSVSVLVFVVEELNHPHVTVCQFVFSVQALSSRVPDQILKVS